MKHIQTKELANILRKKGYNVTLKKRTDGGYLITSINGEKFKGAKGNNRAREITGFSLSEKMKSQRTTATAKRQSYYESVDSEVRKQLRKTQKAWKKRKESYFNKSHKGRISAKQVKKSYQKYGREDTLKWLKEDEKYSKGYSYSGVIEDLIGRLEREFGESAVKDITSYLNENIDTIDQENQTELITRILYNLSNGLIDEKTALNKIRRILGLPSAD